MHRVASLCSYGCGGSEKWVRVRHTQAHISSVLSKAALQQQKQQEKVAWMRCDDSVQSQGHLAGKQIVFVAVMLFAVLLTWITQHTQYYSHNTCLCLNNATHTQNAVENGSALKFCFHLDSRPVIAGNSIPNLASKIQRTLL